VETHLTGFTVSLDRDTPGELLQLRVTADTTSDTGVPIRGLSDLRIPLARLTAATRVACRACYNEVFDLVSADETIPTPRPTSTP
jgi:hypothetical protein